MVCLRNISVDTLHKGDTEDNNNNNNNNNSNNINNNNVFFLRKPPYGKRRFIGTSALEAMIA